MLLANGSLLEGKIQREPEAVVVQQGEDVIRLRASDVVETADSKLSIYEKLRGRYQEAEPTAEDHRRLADWAMTNELLPQAALELLKARRLEPSSRRLLLLERRLDEMVRRPAKPSSPPEAPQEAPPQPANQPAEPAEEMPLPRMPEGSLEHFTRKIQPVLLNACSRCHRGEADDSFPLDASWLHGYGTPKTTEKNLRAALSAIDLGSPEASPLLEAARGPHAGESPLAGPHHDELVERLAAWAYGIGQLNVSELPPAPPEAQLATSRDRIMDSAVTKTTAIRETQVEAATVEAPFPETPEPLQRGLKLRRVGPRDEFDPAIFNEQFRRPEDDLPLNEPAARPKSTR